MEQGGISIIPSSGMVDSTLEKSKSIGITVRTSTGFQAAKEKLKTPWLTNLMREDASGWETLTIAIAEVIGTGILVFLGCGGCIASLGIEPQTLQIAMTFGLAVMIAIQSVGHISGAHINPSITTAALILGKLSLPMTILYIGSQCVGSMLGFAIIKMMTPSELMWSKAGQTESFCVTVVSDKVALLNGVLAEIVATGILVFFACGLWDCRNAKNTDSVPIRFGFCIVALCLVFIPYSGCSLNPARSFGPALWTGNWKHHWVYWVGPLTGAIISSLLYRCLFNAKPEDCEN
ncbi:aquaporin-like [Ceratina calcarata]|uniref:Aquaporin-like n=1 Tax=Ceratina calcarata TaxID=156304 RepID=A0AAJ7J078_9HYME|nr:aquaporin-like [Ceratina calcarata]XP_017881502.1 aquaporin-like [Ceratina calcarata]